MRGRAVIAIVFLILGASRDLRAQAVDAETLARRGLALRRERHDAGALAAFRQSYALRPAPRTLAQIALAEQALGLWVDAEAHLRTALDSTGDPWIAGHRQVLATGLAEIEGHLGTIEVESNVPRAEIWVNGARAATVTPSATPLRVEAGSLAIEVRASGYASSRRDTSVRAGETARETIPLVPLPPASSETRPSLAPLSLPSVGPEHRGGPSAMARAPGLSPDRAMRAVSFVLLGAGALGLAAGTYFGIRTFAVKDERDVYCPPDSARCLDPRGVALDREARSLAERSTAWVAFFGVAAGAGAGLWWLSRGAGSSKLALRLGVDVNTGGASAALRGAW